MRKHHHRGLLLGLQRYWTMIFGDQYHQAKFTREKSIKAGMEKPIGTDGICIQITLDTRYMTNKQTNHPSIYVYIYIIYIYIYMYIIYVDHSINSEHIQETPKYTSAMPLCVVADVS